MILELLIHHNMSSFVETSALGYLKQEAVEFCKVSFFGPSLVLPCLVLNLWSWWRTYFEITCFDKFSLNECVIRCSKVLHF